MHTTTLSILLTSITSLTAQSWSQVATASNPGQIRDASMAFHNASNNCVLFGGWPALGNTWLYDGVDWTNAAPATSPSGRRDFAMASDIARGVIVMFGGSGPLGDTWEFDGTNWANVSPAVGPSARFGHVMAYDVNRGVTVLFGGTSSSFAPADLTDTWEFDGASWTQVVTANAPSEPTFSSMCYDVARGVCVLTGGTSFFGAPDQKTWEYDGSNWVDRTAAVGMAPSATPGLGVQNAKMVYDASRSVSVLYGGRTPNGTFSTDTFEYDGSSWAIVASGTPSSRTRNSMAFDMTRNVPVIYGGLTGNFQTWFQETWEFASSSSAAYIGIGAGCASSSGVASNTASALPVLGQTMVVDIGNMPAPEVMAMVVGLNIVTPSIDLAVIGAPGCPARVTPDLLTLVTGAAGSASYTLAIPVTASLAGAELHTQAIVFEAGINAFGGVVSDAATATLGN